MALFQRSLTAAVAASALAGAFALPVMAQPAPAAPAAAVAGERAPQPHMQRGEHRPADRAAHQAQRLERLKTLLQLTPAQEGAWAQYVAAQQPGTAQPPRPERGEWAKLTTPERLDRMRAMHDARTAEFNKRADATKSFYASLNASQKKAFDVASPLGGMGGKRGMHGPHGGPHGPGKGHGQPQPPAPGAAAR